MIGGRQQLSLAAGCVTRHGTIMHEFLHALGFHHEQKRGDRDDFVTINWGNIQSGNCFLIHYSSLILFNKEQLQLVNCGLMYLDETALQSNSAIHYLYAF